MSHGWDRFGVPYVSTASLSSSSVLSLRVFETFEEASKAALEDSDVHLIYELRRVGTVERSATVKDLRSESS